MSVKFLSYRTPFQELNFREFDQLQVTDRIQGVIDQLKQQVFKVIVKELQLECLISRDLMEDPVITKCHHLFEKTLIEKWFQNTIQNPDHICPACREKTDLCAFVPSPLKEGYNLQSDYEKISQMFTEVLSRKSRLKNPEIDRFLGLGRLKEEIYSLHSIKETPLKESKVREIIAELKKHKETFPALEVEVLIRSLELCLDSSQEKIDEAMNFASTLTDLKEKTFLYKQIIACSPYQFIVYKELSPLLKDPQERSNLLFTAAKLATCCDLYNLAAEFLDEERLQSSCPNSISQEDWKNPTELMKRLPTVPQEIQDFLAGPCPISKKRSWTEFFMGKKETTAGETHILVPVFKNIKKSDGSIVPCTIEALDELDKSSGGVGCRYIDPSCKNLKSGSEKNFEWVVITKGLLPGSRGKSYDSQKKLVESYEGYEEVSAVDVINCILWERRRSGEVLLPNSPYNQARTKEQIPLFRGIAHPCIGHFNSEGFVVDRIFKSVRSDNIGALARRKFQTISY